MFEVNDRQTSNFVGGGKIDVKPRRLVHWFIVLIRRIGTRMFQTERKHKKLGEGNLSQGKNSLSEGRGVKTGDK